MADMTAREAANILWKLDFFLGGNPKILEKAEEALRMAIAALEAQEPRVLKKEELQSLKDPTPMYFEDRGDPEFALACVIEKADNSACYIYSAYATCFYTPLLFSDYNIMWRCWTHEPTTEQVANTPWGSP